MQRTVAMAFITAAWVVSTLVLSGPAQAVSACPTTPKNYDFVDSQWPTAQAQGVRAPVQLRNTGLICGDDGTGFVASWIGIQQLNGFQLAQAGFDHHYGPKYKQDVYCRFWAIGEGAPHFYNCTNDTGGDYVYFEVTKAFSSGSDRTYVYYIYDCGEDGYATCSILNREQAAFAEADAVAVGAESDYGKGCADRIMGTASRPVNVGTSTNPTQFQASVSGPFSVKDLTPDPATCSHYKGSFSNTVTSAWDDRN